jgi:hypothetical protein
MDSHPGIVPAQFLTPRQPGADTGVRGFFALIGAKSLVVVANAVSHTSAR